MSKQLREQIKFSVVLPRELEVEIHRAEGGGFWARVKNLPGCVTQADNFLELIEMINDAVFTYFEIPVRAHTTLGVYVPNLSEKIRERMLHKQTEKFVTEIMRNRRTLAFSRT